VKSVKPFVVISNVSEETPIHTNFELL
jgi:hypothetical protein